MKISLLIIYSIFSLTSNLNSQNIDKMGKNVPGSSTKLNKNFSVTITNALIDRNPKYISYDTTKMDWNYELGFMLYAIWNVYEKTGNQKYFDYVKTNLDYFITTEGDIKTYSEKKYRLDDIAPGRVILYLYKATKDNKYLKSANLLRSQLSEQPRTKEGGFWHKGIYPHQMWLDGLYMAEPFFADYAKTFHETNYFDDIANQFILIYKHTLDKKSGLLYHGWDESKSQKWANPKTGDSPSFWGRAMGWYMMGLVDVLDYFPKDNKYRKNLITILQKESKAIIQFQDRKTHLWYLILDKPNQKGNYLETSSSAMFSYVFAKAYNKGYLSKSYMTIAKNIQIGIEDNFIKTDNDNLPSLYNTISGAGLGGKSYRNGTFEYYVSESKRINDFKGIAPLILASIEIEKSLPNSKLFFKSTKDKIVGLDNYFNDEWMKNKQGREVRYHYIWEDTANSGYSELGDLIKSVGAEITELREAPTQKLLDKISVYIIVDPDTPLETAHPNYIEDASIRNIIRWVKSGGVLALFANDKGNCEFTHLNKLSGEFGIHFNEDSRNHVTGNNYDMGKFDNLPSNMIFHGVNKIYLKEISTLKLSKKAKAILTDKGDVIMAFSKYGKGFVFAVGDPWLYNEYIDHKKLSTSFNNKKAAENLFRFLLSKAATVK